VDRGLIIKCDNGIQKEKMGLKFLKEVIEVGE